jgi:hypothetical protein
MVAASQTMRGHTGESNPMYGKRHTEESRQKMSEAAKRRWAQGREKKADNGFKMLIAAIVRQAVKDGAAWFFETERGKGYCAAAGVDPVKYQGERA